MNKVDMNNTNIDRHLEEIMQPDPLTQGDLESLQHHLSIYVSHHKLQVYKVMVLRPIFSQMRNVLQEEGFTKNDLEQAIDFFGEVLRGEVAS